jgi:hypothetical protein
MTEKKFYVMIYTIKSVNIEKVEVIEANNIIDARMKIDEKYNPDNYKVRIYTDREYRELLQILSNKISD